MQNQAVYHPGVRLQDMLLLIRPLITLLVPRHLHVASRPVCQLQPSRDRRNLVQGLRDAARHGERPADLPLREYVIVCAAKHPSGILTPFLFVDLQSFTFPIPKSLPSGQYLIRVEHVRIFAPP